MILLPYIAQLASEQPALFIYGPLGIMTSFFMLASMKLIALGAKLIVAIKEDSAELRKDIRTLAHRIDGHTRQLLADSVERETSSPAMKAHARAAIAKIDARMDK